MTIDYLFENINCNHFEAVNTKVLSENFVDIFQDKLGNSGFFKTELR